MDASGISILVGSAVTALGAAGTACRFLWNKVERRFNKIEAELKKCQARELRALHYSSGQNTVIELLWREVVSSNPGSMVLARAKQLLDDLKHGRGFPLNPLPDEFRDLAERLDGDGNDD